MDNLDLAEMDIHDRLRYLRKHLKLSTRVFGQSIGIETGGAISNMEHRRRDITQRTIRDICREYNVREDWLVYGRGPIFYDLFAAMEIEQEVKHLAEDYASLPDADKSLVKEVLYTLLDENQMSDSDKMLIRSLLSSLHEKYKGNDTN